MIPDWLYMTKRRALEYGFAHEGTHFGVPVWCREEGDGLEVATKLGILETVLTFGAFMVQWANQYRDHDNQIMFAFCIREIAP